MQRQRYNWTLPRATLALGERTAVMGILNVTPDSFSDGGRYFDTERAVARGLEIQREGADIVDIGGESTRPGSAIVPEDEELRRVMPVVESLCRVLTIPVSIDTTRARVARRAIEAGAQVVNDVSGFRFDPTMAQVVLETNAAVVLMHSRGPRNGLHNQPSMVDPVQEVYDELSGIAGDAVKLGIPQTSVVIDPGIGFGKGGPASLKILQQLDRLATLQYPLLIGTSRKSFIRSIVPDSPEGRLLGTAASVAAAITRGAHIVRVHDVVQMRAVADVADAIARS
jgi:dihydropteroate synthase